MKKSIKSKIIRYFLILIIITVTFFEAFSIYSVRHYYYSFLAGIMHNQARYNAQMYLTYMSDYTLADVVLEDRDLFYRSNSSQVQIINNSGIVIYDSMASTDIGKKLETTDVLNALEGRSSSYFGKQTGGDINVLSVSYPLNNRDERVGIIRLITSLHQTDRIIQERIVILLLFGGVVIAISLLLTIFMSNSIIRPINDLIDVAIKLADGQFDIKANERGGDEISDLARTMNFMSDNILKKEEIKNDFISSVSHELRTPLTSIRGWAITLQSADISDKEIIDEGLKIIEKESGRLSGMVEDLLDFSRFTSGKITLKKSEIDLIEIVKNIISQMKPRISDKELDVLLNYDKENLTIIADSDRIKQVIINILDNAIKFTDVGSLIVVNIIDEKYETCVEVIDSGIGISKEEINLVTDKFYKGSSSNSHTGLGLSISEEIIELHGGRFEITSVLDEGTTVKIFLPKGV